MTFKKRILQLHRWPGLLSWLVVSHSLGCLYVFIDELKPVFY